MRMIRLALITVFALGFSLHATAGEIQFSAYSRMISWEQLEKMTPEKRAAYLEELRQLLLEMEQMQAERAKRDPELRLRMTSMYDIFRTLVGDAEAMGAGTGVNNSANWCRGPVFTLIPGIVNRCVRSNSRAAQHYHLDRLIEFNRRKAAAERANPASATRAPAAGAAVPAAAPAAAPGGTIPQGQLSADEVQRQRRIQRQKARERQQALAAQAATEGGGHSAPNPPPRPRRTETDNTVNKDAVMCAAEAAAIPANTGLACNPEKINEARRNFDGQTQQNCIYAGHVRTYRDRVARPGQCLPVFQYCVPNDGSNDTEGPGCREATDPAHAKIPMFRCEPTEVLCNPLLFGVRRSPEGNEVRRLQAICVPQAGAATYACYNAIAESGDRHVDLMNMTDNLRSKNENLLTPEEWEQTQAQRNQLHRLWDQLATSLHDMCVANPKENELADSRQVFCEECHWIRLRLVEMNALRHKDGKQLCDQLVLGSTGAGTLTPSQARITGNSAPTTADVLPGGQAATLTADPNARRVPAAAPASR
ncbi:MAG: hypothetical protein V4760_16270 [Bdellovibrionota bacterium]